MSVESKIIDGVLNFIANFDANFNPLESCFDKTWKPGEVEEVE